MIDKLVDILLWVQGVIVIVLSTIMGFKSFWVVYTFSIGGVGNIADVADATLKLFLFIGIDYWFIRLLIDVQRVGCGVSCGKKMAWRNDN
jgi:hypothetical protein